MNKSGRAVNWAIAAMLVLAMLPWAPPASAQTAGSAVPQPWISYAQLVSRQFQAWLEADSDPANQLHAYLEKRVLDATGDAPPPAVSIRAWIGPDGAVTRVEFDSLGDPGADATLRTLLTQQPISEAPPADMLQPLRVRLHLELNPDAPPPAGKGSGTAGCGTAQDCRPAGAQ